MIANAVCILHNMVVEKRRPSFAHNLQWEQRGADLGGLGGAEDDAGAAEGRKNVGAAGGDQDVEVVLGLVSGLMLGMGSGSTIVARAERADAAAVASNRCFNVCVRWG